MSAMRYYMAALPMNMDDSSDERFVVVEASAETLRACLLRMVRNLEPLVRHWPLWDLTLATGEGARERLSEWTPEASQRGREALTSRAVGAAGPYEIGGQPLDDDGPNLYGTRVEAEGGTLRECLSAAADELVPVIAEADLWDFTLDVGAPGEVR